MKFSQKEEEEYSVHNSQLFQEERETNKFSIVWLTNTHDKCYDTPKNDLEVKKHINQGLLQQAVYRCIKVRLVRPATPRLFDIIRLKINRNSFIFYF